MHDTPYRFALAWSRRRDPRGLASYNRISGLEFTIRIPPFLGGFREQVDHQRLQSGVMML